MTGYFSKGLILLVGVASVAASGAHAQSSDAGSGETGEEAVEQIRFGAQQYRANVEEEKAKLQKLIGIVESQAFKEIKPFQEFSNMSKYEALAQRSTLSCASVGTSSRRATHSRGRFRPWAVSGTECAMRPRL